MWMMMFPTPSSKVIVIEDKNKRLTIPDSSSTPTPRAPRTSCAQRSCGHSRRGRRLTKVFSQGWSARTMCSTSSSPRGSLRGLPSSSPRGLPTGTPSPSPPSSRSRRPSRRTTRTSGCPPPCRAPAPVSRHYVHGSTTTTTTTATSSVLLFSSFPATLQSQQKCLGSVISHSCANLTRRPRGRPSRRKPRERTSRARHDIVG